MKKYRLTDRQINVQDCMTMIFHNVCMLNIIVHNHDATCICGSIALLDNHVGILSLLFLQYATFVFNLFAILLLNKGSDRT